MTTKDSTFKKTELITMAILAILAMLMTTVAVIPSLRTQVKDYFLNEDRQIVAKATGPLSAQGPRATVLKIKSKNSLFLEVYNIENPEGMSLIAKIPLFESRDGFFLLQGNATNLAISDIDKDGSVEIVAPTYDEQMIPRLNIFRYNIDSKSFDRVNAPPGFEF